MLRDKLKTSNKNQMKINIIYLVLIISNILLFIGLIQYYAKVGLNIHVEHFDVISGMIATIIILGYISSKLPKIKDMGESSIYGTSYFIIICAVGLITSYFNATFNKTMDYGPYLEMFRTLCEVLIFIILATNLKSFREVMDGKFSRKNQMVCLILFAFCGLFASFAVKTINHTPTNIRCLVVMISGLLGGPVVGIPVGIISGAYRYTLGGPTALPCALSTVISGIIGSLIFIWNDKKFPKIIPSIILMFLFTGLEMLIIIVMTPADISFPFVSTIYPIMLFGSVIGMLLFSVTLKETRGKIDPQPAPEDEKMNEIENELKRHDAENKELKNEIEELKTEIEVLKEQKSNGDEL